MIGIVPIRVLIKITGNSYNDANALSDVFSYCGNVNKCAFWEGLGICLNNIHTAIDSMRVVQKIYGKENGKYLHHIIVNSVSYMNGNKLTNLYSFANDIKQYLKTEYSFLQWKC